MWLLRIWTLVLVLIKQVNHWPTSPAPLNAFCPIKLKGLSYIQHSFSVCFWLKSSGYAYRFTPLGWISPRPFVHSFFLKEAACFRASVCTAYSWCVWLCSLIRIMIQGLSCALCSWVSLMLPFSILLHGKVHISITSSSQMPSTCYSPQDSYYGHAFHQILPHWSVRMLAEKRQFCIRYDQWSKLPRGFQKLSEHGNKRKGTCNCSWSKFLPYVNSNFWIPIAFLRHGTGQRTQAFTELQFAVGNVCTFGNCYYKQIKVSQIMICPLIFTVGVTNKGHCAWLWSTRWSQ